MLYKPPTIDTIEPTLLSTSNTSIPIIVTGSNFWDSPSLVCRFDSLHVTAKWISKFQMECKLPPMAPGYVEFEISNNGMDFTTHGLVIRVLDDSIMSSIKSSNCRSKFNVEGK